MRFPKRVSFRFVAGTILVALLAWPATTRQGVNFKVTEKRLPAIIKGMDFLVRDYEYRHLAAEITRGCATEESKAEALLQWTHEHIRPVPPGWPVVDDHITHIIIRGYGTKDQVADVFTTLATYAGIRSFWRVSRGREGSRPRVLSFLRMGGQWTVWDVAEGIAIRDTAGHLMSVQQLGWQRFGPPPLLRAEKQMPLPRVLFELRQAGKALLGRSLETDG